MIVQVKQLVEMVARAMVLFYQLDVSANETTKVCLYNLLTSLVLKNPVYTKVVELFRTAHRDSLQKIEMEIEKAQK